MASESVDDEYSVGEKADNEKQLSEFMHEGLLPIESVFFLTVHLFAGQTRSSCKKNYSLRESSKRTTYRPRVQEK